MATGNLSGQLSSTGGHLRGELSGSVRYIQGPAGEGGYYLPRVDEDGVLTWVPSSASLPAVESANVRGPAGKDGKDGKDGADGAAGPRGPEGAAGKDGRTPVKHVDYWTEADQDEIKDYVLGALREKDLSEINAEIDDIEKEMTHFSDVALHLAFNVHGGTSAPQNPTENDIWINTDAEITSWAYSATEPSNPTEGKVWLVANASITLDTFVSGNITIAPLSARQYVGGVWVTKEAKSYHNGEWKEWLTLLINGADECVDVTGGWESLAVNISGIGTSARALNVTHGTDYIELTGGGGGQGGMYVTKNKITCDGSTSLRITGEINAYDKRIKIAALSSKTSAGIVAEWTAPSGSSGAELHTFVDEPLFELPSGEYYIACSIYSTDQQYIRLSKVYASGAAGGAIQPGGGGSGGGEISAELIEQAVKNYLEANPIEETDPTVPDWAKQPEKPEYTAKEVGAQPAGDYAEKDEIPTKTSQLENDSGFITVAVATLLNYYLKSETYAKSETYSATEVNELVNGLSARLDAFFDTDDTTLDQMSEIVAYIKSNKSLIDSITTSKVGVSDIINNLTTSVANKPLSAAQGVALKALIDAIIVPTKLSQLTNDKGYITGYTETDPTVPSWAKASNKPSYTSDEIGVALNLDWQNPMEYEGSVTAILRSLDRLIAAIEVPTKLSDLTNNMGYITGYTETDPTVPSWAKAASKPSYTKSEVGLGNVDNVKQYSDSNPPPYPVESVNGKTGAVSLSASDVGALASANYTTKALTVTYEAGTSETVTLVVAK